MQPRPSKGVYLRDRDLLVPEVLRGLQARILSGEVVYIQFDPHFLSWGALDRPYQASRVQSGSGGSSKRIAKTVANREAKVLVVLCRLLSSMGAFWSFTHPVSSQLFKFEPVRDLLELPGVSDILVTQPPNLPWDSGGALSRTRTRIWTNIPGVDCQRSSQQAFHNPLGSISWQVPAASFTPCGVPLSVCHVLAMHLLAAVRARECL